MKSMNRFFVSFISIYIISAAYCAAADKPWVDSSSDTGHCPESCSANNPEEAEFVRAIDAGDIKKVTEILNAKKIDINKEMYAWLPCPFCCEFAPPLALAIGRAKELQPAELTRLLLSKGANPNVRYRKQPILLWAVERQYEQVVELLIASGADVNATGERGLSALWLAHYPDAIYYSSGKYKANEEKELRISKMLLAKGADINIRNKDGDTLLTYAVKRKAPTKYMEFLIANGAKVKTEVHNPDLAKYAVRRMDKELLKLVLDNGGTITMDDAASILAYDDSELVQILLKHKDNIINFDDYKALLAAVSTYPGPSKEKREKLAKEDTHIEYQGSSIGNSLKEAKSYRPLVSLLLSYGVNINAKNSYGTTLLYRVTTLEPGCKDLAEFLLSKGADPNIQDKNGGTVLHSMVGKDTKPEAVEVVKLLLSKGANPNMRDNKGRTPVDYAIIFGRGKYFKEIMELLISSGADLNTPDDEGYTTLSRVKGSYPYNKEKVDFLVSKGAIPRQLEQPITEWSESIELTPNHVKAYQARAYLYFEKGDYDKAAADYTKAIELDPTRIEDYYRRAIANYEIGNYDLAWEDVHKVNLMREEKMEETAGRKYKHPGVSEYFLNQLKKASGRDK